MWKELSGWHTNFTLERDILTSKPEVKNPISYFSYPNYLHIRIIWVASFLDHHAYEVNLTEQQVQDLVAQFLRSEDLWFDGQRIDSRNIRELKIFQTNFYQRFQASYFHDTYPSGYTADFSGVDVTRKFITNAPGAFIDETQRLASEMFEQGRTHALDGNWVYGAVALQMQELAVIKCAGKLGIDLGRQNVQKLTGNKITDDFVPFGLKYDALAKETLRQSNVKMPIMAKGLRDLRTAVMHNGYCPTEEEVNSLMTFTTGLLKRLAGVPSKSPDQP